MIGPGKYDDALTLARISTHAQAALLIIIGGDHGDGFSCQTVDPELQAQIPDLLEHIAADIRRTLQQGD